MGALQQTVNMHKQFGSWKHVCVCVYVCMCVSVILLQVNKCLCLSLKYICSQRVCSVYQLLTVGASINIQITHEFIHFRPMYVWLSNLNMKLLSVSTCVLCVCVCLCINCDTSSVYRKGETVDNFCSPLFKQVSKENVRKRRSRKQVKKLK